MNSTARQLFEDALRATGVDLQHTAKAVATFAAERSIHLATIASEAGISEAVAAEADRVWLFAAGRAVRSADATDARAIGIIHGLLVGMVGA